MVQYHNVERHDNFFISVTLRYKTISFFLSFSFFFSFFFFQESKAVTKLGVLVKYYYYLLTRPIANKVGTLTVTL